MQSQVTCKSKTVKTALYTGGNSTDAVTISLGTHSSLLLRVKLLGFQLSFQGWEKGAGNGELLE